MEVQLKVARGPEKGKNFKFTEPNTFIVGRGGPGRNVDFQLSSHDPYVSRNHFILEIAPPRVFLKDMQSLNPPTINGLVRVEDELHDGDIIEVGFTQLSVHISGKVKTRVVKCKTCSDVVEILIDEKPPDYCKTCVETFTTEKEKTGPPTNIVCSCGKDITKQANSDRRAQELLGVVRYLCEKCANVKIPKPVRKIDDYTLMKKIGKGGMGKVYQVYHEKTCRVLALKQLINLNNNEQVKYRFEREIRYTKELVHPNILRFVDSGITSEGPYLVIEHVTGGNIGDLLKKQVDRIEPAAALNLLKKALFGLEVMHKKNIVHRDIKPENILLQPRKNGSAVPKLADFGLAKKYSEAGGSHLTKLGMGMGTILYMPPEQLKNVRDIREPADIYAMGVTLYYLLTGEYPYNFPTPEKINKIVKERGIKDHYMALQVFMRENKIKNPEILVLTEEPTPIRHRNPNISSSLAGVVDRSIRKDSKSRYADATAFRQALMYASL